MIEIISFFTRNTFTRATSHTFIARAAAWGAIRLRNHCSWTVLTITILCNWTTASTISWSINISIPTSFSGSRTCISTPLNILIAPYSLVIIWRYSTSLTFSIIDSTSKGMNIVVDITHRAFIYTCCLSASPRWISWLTSIGIYINIPTIVIIVVVENNSI